VKTPTGDELDIKVIDRDGFWAIVDWARDKTASPEQTVELIGEFLERLLPEQIVAFHRELWARMHEAYRQDLWAAAALIHGGCGYDGFCYFRGWLITQGRQFFEAVLADPRRVGQRIVRGQPAECEEMLFVATLAHERRTGREIEGFPPEEGPPAGQPWTEADLPRLFPALYRLFHVEEQT
jgi:hypothetical protein